MHHLNDDGDYMFDKGIIASIEKTSITRTDGPQEILTDGSEYYHLGNGIWAIIYDSGLIFMTSNSNEFETYT